MIKPVVWSCGKDHGTIAVPLGSRVICPCGAEAKASTDKTKKEIDRIIETLNIFYEHYIPDRIFFLRKKTLLEKIKNWIMDAYK